MTAFAAATRRATKRRLEVLSLTCFFFFFCSMAVAGMTTSLSRVQVSSSRGEVIKPLLSECRHSTGENSDFLLEMQELYFLLGFWSHVFPDDDNGWPRDLLAFRRYLQTLNPVLHPQKTLLHNTSKKLMNAQRLLEEFGEKKRKKSPDSLWKNSCQILFFWNFQFKMCFPAKNHFSSKEKEEWKRKDGEGVASPKW